MQRIVSFVQVNFNQGPEEANAYYLPYSAGIVLAYALQENPDWQAGEIVWRRDPIEATAQRLKHSNVVGFSTYVWNHQYNYKLAQRVKELNPNCLIILGGPEPALEDPEFFIKHPWADAIVKREGEFIFAGLLKNINNIAAVPGLIINQDRKAIDTGEAERIDDLDQLPSPYATGLFDKLVADNPTVTWNGTVETNRGCPYQCTFCDWGSLTYNKVKKFNLERVFADIEWIGKHCENITFTDANLGMFVERDNEIVSKVIEVMHRYRKIKIVTASFAKNQKNEVVEIVRRLVHESIGAVSGLIVSIQTMDENVLDIVKRRNLEQHKIKEIFALCDRYKIPVNTEIIFGLPGETEKSWKETLWQIFRIGNPGISIWHSQLLENAEMNLKQRDFYKLETVEMHDYFSGSGGSSYDNNEVEESVKVVVSTRDIPREKMLELMVWNVFITTFHIHGLTSYITRVMAKQGIDYSIFYDKLWERLQLDPWWSNKFNIMKSYYQEWIKNGKVKCEINGIRIPGYHLSNALIMICHAENQIDRTFEIIREFVKEFDLSYGNELVDFQRSSIIDYKRLSQLPQEQNFNFDFVGHLLDDTELTKPIKYKFDTLENKDMAQKVFLQNFWFARRRNFGKANVYPV